MPKQKLNNQFCKSIIHSGSHTVINYFDTELRGFMLEVRKTGGKTFYLRYQHQKKTRVQKIGDAVAMLSTQARKEAIRIRSEIDLGKDFYAEKAIRSSTPTLQQFFDEFYVPHIKQRKRSWESDISMFKNHILPKLGKMLMSDITRYMVSSLHTKQVEKGYRPGSANKIPIFIRTAFNLAMKWEIPGVVNNPASKFDLFPENNNIERYLSREEAARLIIAVEQSQNKSLKYIVMFLLLTGARRNECLHAKWKDFDFVAMSWTIPLNKSGKAHHVPITQSLVNLLKTVPREGDNEFLFPNVKTGKPYTNIFHIWNTARIKAGLLDVRLHDLRHTFASTLVNSGRSIYEVQALLGHHNVSVTQRYAHLSNDSLMSAADCAASLFPNHAMTSESTVEVEPFMIQQHSEIINTLPI